MCDDDAFMRDFALYKNRYSLHPKEKQAKEFTHIFPIHPNWFSFYIENTIHNFNQKSFITFYNTIQIERVNKYKTNHFCTRNH